MLQHRVGPNLLLARERRFQHGGLWDAPPERLLRLGRRAAGAAGTAATGAPHTEEEAHQVGKGGCQLHAALLVPSGRSRLPCSKHREYNRLGGHLMCFCPPTCRAATLCAWT